MSSRLAKSTKCVGLAVASPFIFFGIEVLLDYVGLKNFGLVGPTTASIGMIGIFLIFAAVYKRREADPSMHNRR